MRRPTLNEVVDYFDPATNSKIYTGTPEDVIRKRVHSKGYHNLRSFLSATQRGAKTQAAIDQEASGFGIKCADAWGIKFARG